MLRYAHSLNKSRKIELSIKAYEKLEEELDQDIRESNKRSEVNEEMDDEKISLKKLMYSQLCELEADETNRNESYIEATQSHLLNTSLFRSKLNLLRNTYKISDTIKTAKLSQTSD
jgi:hypothetical protein